MFFSGIQKGLFFGARLRRPGGQGGFRPPPYAPLDPLYPLQTAEGSPRTPLVSLGVLPLASRPQEPSRALHRVLLRARHQSGAETGMCCVCFGTCGTSMLQQRGPVDAVPCHHSKDQPEPWRRGRDQLRQAAFSPKANTRVAKRLGFHKVKANLKGDSGPPGYAVDPAGHAPARLAAHCYLATGGPGASMRHAPFGRPRRPLGTFPRGESTSSARRRAKPLTKNRFLVVGKGKTSSLFLFC